jgi:hypothetical protein
MDLFSFIVFPFSFSYITLYFSISYSASSLVLLHVGSILLLRQGDLEQLVIVPNPTAVGQQCSATRIPLLDPALLQATRSVTAGGSRQRRGRRSKGRKGVDYHHNEPAAPWKLTNKLDDVVDTAAASTRDSASKVEKKPERGTSTSKQKDTDSSDEDDFYEGSGSEGSALGEGQYGKVFTYLHFAISSTRHREHPPFCPHILAPKFLKSGVGGSTLSVIS